ncbi:MAG: urea amidolyase associated protein UAAP2 [Syntrophobacteraceae bacterium]
MSETLVKSALRESDAAYDETVPAGVYWRHRLARGEVLRIVDLHGNQAVDTLFYNAADPTERYSPNNTMREQGNVYISTGTKIYSSENRVMLTVVADTCGRHDTLGSACSAESNTVRYSLGKRYMHSCRDVFLQGILDWGHGRSKRDQVSNINFFMNVPVNPEGGSHFEDGLSEPGKYVELRAEMDVVVLVSNCPQLNNPCNAYNPTPVRMLIWR